MSYILEALRKSERERQAGQAAPPVSIPLNPTPPRRHGLAWAVALLFLLNGTVLGYLWLTRWQSKEPATQLAQTASTEHADAAAPTQKAAAPSATETRTASAPADSHSSDIPPPAKEKASALANAEPLPAARVPEKKAAKTTRPHAVSVKPPSPEPIPSEITESAAAMTKKRPVKPSEKSRPQIDPKPMAEPAISENLSPPVAFAVPVSTPEPRDPASGHAENPDIPFMYEMPADFQQRIGPVTINVFAYSELPEERFAIIDMKKYRVGDRLGNGAKLLEIRADSLVLQSEGRTFRVPRP
ncbi:general secretion pathway protein GspB [Methylocaldum szegediense]|mgnify:CR=1 FL=1|uniref:General secretion pathway protein B n=1 Tax=Methylocaldum szegediense TaxID=73780 RepID=A0ABN8X7X0_9GAMM|nr:general secretion pathway protein GspB [Methylocaldum szegediense]CAI8890591.1 general secretion pathway protein B [Methylocaldum szegediense]